MTKLSWKRFVIMANAISNQCATTTWSRCSCLQPKLLQVVSDTN